MSEFTDKIKGAANEAAGKVKQAIGRSSDDTHLEAEGVAQEGEGKVQKGIGNAKGAVKSVIDKLGYRRHAGEGRRHLAVAAPFSRSHEAKSGGGSVGAAIDHSVAVIAIAISRGRRGIISRRRSVVAISRRGIIAVVIIAVRRDRRADTEAEQAQAYRCAAATPATAVIAAMPAAATVVAAAMISAAAMPAACVGRSRGADRACGEQRRRDGRLDDVSHEIDSR
jgi:uncharacterized protein YjbJ (UPF0337 family)